MVGTAKKWFTERATEIKTSEDFDVKFKKTFDLKVSKDGTWVTEIPR